MEYQRSIGQNGVLYLSCGTMKFAVMIPSRNRTEKASRHPLLDVATFVVHEEEGEEYREALGSLVPVVTHTGRGVCQSMNALIQIGFSEPDVTFVVRFDDDFLGLQWMFSRGGHSERIKDAPRIVGAAVALGSMCRDAGIGLFGANLSPRPQARSALQPFLLRHWIAGGMMGVCDSRLRAFDDALTMDDIQLSLASMVLTGMVLTDQRYYVVTDTGGQGKDRGGVASDRSLRQHDVDLQTMAERYPGVVVPLWDEKLPSGMTRLRIEVPK